MVAPGPSASSDGEKSKRADRSPESCASTGAISVFDSAAAATAASTAPRFGFGNAAIDRTLRRVGALQRLGHQLGEGGVGALDPAVAIDDRHRHRRREEDAGEAHLGGAQILGRLLARRAIEDERARGARQTILAEGDPVQQPHRQALAVAALQIEIELIGDDIARRAGNACEQNGTAAGDEIVEFEAAGADLREIVIEPACQRRIHVGDGARCIAGEKARRRMVEKIDRMLQFLEDILMPLALARHVGDASRASRAWRRRN